MEKKTYKKKLIIKFLIIIILRHLEDKFGSSNYKMYITKIKKSSQLSSTNPCAYA